MQQQQQQQPQSPSLKSAPPPPNLVTTEQIQKYLEDNKNLILAILENQNLGKVAECNQLQAVLQKNLMNLAAIADAQPPPSGPSQVPPNSVAQQGNYMHQAQGAMPQQQPQPQGAMSQQQPPQGAMSPQQPQGAMSQQQSQQQGGGGVSKLQKVNSLRSQDQQQQMLHFQQQQQIYGQMAMRAGANSGMHGMNQMMQHALGTSGGMMDARGIKQDAPENASGEGQRKFASGRGN